jgi:hypothetical protein
MSANVPPRLDVAVLCQSIEYDGQGCVFALNEPMHTSLVEANAANQLVLEQFNLYCELWPEGAHGTFDFWLQVRSHSTILSANHQPMPTVRSLTFDSATVPNAPLSVVFEIERIVFPHPGVYHFYAMFSPYASLNERPGHALPTHLRIIRAEPGDQL